MTGENYPELSPDPTVPAVDEVQHPENPSFWPMLIALGLIALLIGGLAGYWFGRARVPGDDSIDVGFARDMSVHHEQAVQMAALAYDRAQDPAVRSLAFDILTTQQGQIGIMSGWLDAWGRAWTSSGPRMAWMGMPVNGLMPGMATAEQMAELRAATGEQAEILFLQLMIPHHQGGLDMARHAAGDASQVVVRRLAQGIVDAQTLEIEYMEELLAARGQTPPPSLPTMDMGDDGHEH